LPVATGTAQPAARFFPDGQESAPFPVPGSLGRGRISRQLRRLAAGRRPGTIPASRRRAPAVPGELKKGKVKIMALVLGLFGTLIVGFLIALNAFIALRGPG